MRRGSPLRWKDKDARLFPKQKKQSKRTGCSLHSQDKKEEGNQIADCGHCCSVDVNQEMF